MLINIDDYFSQYLSDINCRWESNEKREEFVILIHSNSFRENAWWL